ncbi:flavin reductase family protein [Endozoicomonas sp. ALC020]|uniref:flavin reductase family protein n=1 Tax=unclassified Endozoicomonas TaxID=2644528 RepID=UPI003BB0C529
MHLNVEEMSDTQAYHLLTQTVIPRPVAWVLTANEEGDFNLAPFSFFTAISSNPPLIMFSVGSKPSGEIKDTRRNILRSRSFVVHIAPSSLAEEMTETARTLDYGQSELERIHLTTNNDWQQSLPRLSECDIALYCQLYEYQEIGKNKQGLVFGEIKQAYLSDKVASKGERLVIDATQVDPISRLGGNDYAALGKIITIQRPV